MANQEIRQELNIFNREHTTTATEGVERVSYDPDFYTSPTEYFEIVAKNANASAQDVDLEWGITSYATISVPGSTSSYTRFRVQTDSALARQEYDVTWTSSDISILAARIVLLQNAATITRTQTQIEIGSYEMTDWEAYAGPNYPKYWYYDSAHWDPLPSSVVEEEITRNTQMSIGRYESNQWGAGSFTVGASGYDLARLKVWVNTSGSPTNELSCEIYSDNSGEPGSSIGTASNTLTGYLSSEEQEYTFSTPISLSATWRYWIVLKSSGVDASNYFNVHFDNTGTEEMNYTDADPVSWAEYDASSDIYRKLYATNTFNFHLNYEGAGDMDELYVKLQYSYDFTTWTDVSGASLTLTVAGSRMDKSLKGLPLYDKAWYRMDAYCADDMDEPYIYNAKIVLDQYEENGIFQCVPEYHMINAPQASTGETDHFTYFDPAEWNDEDGYTHLVHCMDCESSTDSVSIQDAANNVLDGSDILGNEDSKDQQSFSISPGAKIWNSANKADICTDCGEQGVAQRYPGDGGKAIGFLINIEKVASPGDLLIELRNDDTSLPGDTQHASATIDDANIEANNRWSIFLFDSGYDTTDGTDYWCCAVHTGGGVGVNYYDVYRNAVGRELGAARNGSWASGAGNEYAFNPIEAMDMPTAQNLNPDIEAVTGNINGSRILVFYKYVVAGGATYTLTPDIDAILRAAGKSKTADLDAILQLISTKTFDVDGILQAVRSSTADLDAILKALGLTRAVDLDAFLRAVKTEDLDVDAILQLVSTKDVDLDAIIKAVGLMRDVAIDGIKLLTLMLYCKP
jgi:hypothetical protein